MAFGLGERLGKNWRYNYEHNMEHNSRFLRMTLKSSILDILYRSKMRQHLLFTNVKETLDNMALYNKNKKIKTLNHTAHIIYQEAPY